MMTKMLRQSLVLGVIFAVNFACSAQNVDPYYASAYSIRNLGGIPSALSSPGALVFKNGDPSKLIIRFDDKFSTVTVQRGSDNHITGFSAATPFTAAEGYISSLVNGPGGVLFFNNGSAAAIGETKPGDAQISKYVPANTISFNGETLGNVSALAFVPTGFTGAGKLKIAVAGLSANSGILYDTTVSADGTGTYNIANPTTSVSLPFMPESIVYNPAGQPKFPVASILGLDYTAGKLISLELNANGDPVASTARTVVTGIVQALGIARDPLTGDFLITQYSGSSIYLFSALPAAPPVVTLTAPANNAKYGNRDYVDLTATASVPGGSAGEIVVEFFADTVSQGIIRTAPYQITTVFSTAGNYKLTAVATANGLSTTSSVVNIVVTNVPNILPVVQLTYPTNDTSIFECSTITLSASASDADGSVTNVAFFVNNLLLGNLNKLPYSITLDGLPFADNIITAVATDNFGASTTSAVYHVTIKLLPLHTLKDSLLSGNRIQLCFRGSLNSNYLFESTTSVNGPISWSPVSTNKAPVATDGLISFIDPQLGTLPKKFYRARQVP